MGVELAGGLPGPRPTIACVCGEASRSFERAWRGRRTQTGEAFLLKRYAGALRVLLDEESRRVEGGRALRRRKSLSLVAPLRRAAASKGGRCSASSRGRSRAGRRYGRGHSAVEETGRGTARAEERGREGPRRGTHRGSHRGRWTRCRVESGRWGSADRPWAGVAGAADVARSQQGRQLLHAEPKPRAIPGP